VRTPDDPVFKAFRRFNDPAQPRLPGLRERLDSRVMPQFPTQGLPDRIARELARRRIITAKEMFESFEFFERVRRRVRGAVVADLCCGHGLTGMLFGVFERRVERVVLVDHIEPINHARTLAALTALAPWLPAKVEYHRIKISQAVDVLPAGASVLAVHACGVRTDRAIDVALALRGRIAVMPCCYYQTALDGPRAAREALGAELATDVHRTYRLEAAGYDVDWQAVPAEITPMNRILVASPARPEGGSATP
jgi:hypothetical protein